MAKMAFWTAVLLLHGLSTGIAMNRAITRLDGFLPLDDAPDSVDDMYDGCKDSMKMEVQTYLQKEKNTDSTFKRAWDEGEKNKKKRGYKKGKQRSTSLGKEQAVAIYVYTLDNPNIYLDFNEAVRTQRHEYRTTFRYHALHFFLTDALQTLNARKPEEERCLKVYRRSNSQSNHMPVQALANQTVACVSGAGDSCDWLLVEFQTCPPLCGRAVKVYRRSNRSFSQDVLNKVIRFGSFASSSRGWYPKAERFGDKSCFEIYTCLGADVSLFSKLGESETEVLIPPYEAFEVTKIERRSAQKTLSCEVVYKLKSTEVTVSNLNCALCQM